MAATRRRWAQASSYAAVALALVKTRPQIFLFAPPRLIPGEAFEATVRLVCTAAVDVDQVDVELEGAVVTYVSDANGRHASQRVLLRLAARFADDAQLGPGEHDLRVRFDLPDDVPGSYAGNLLSVVYGLRVHVDIPWWPDARANFPMHVAARRFASKPQRTVFVTRLAGPAGTEPYAEVSLGSEEIEPGQTLHGAVALSNVEHNRYSGITLSLLASERTGAPLREMRHETSVARWRIAVDEPREGAPLRFKLALPEALRASFSYEGISLWWVVLVTIELRLSRDIELRVPLHIRPAELGADAVVQAPLAVGKIRQQLVWTKVAHKTGFTLEGDELTFTAAGHGAGGAYRLRVRERHTGRLGTRLEGVVDVVDVVDGVDGIDGVDGRLPGHGLGLGLGLHVDDGQLRARDTVHSKRLEDMLVWPDAELIAADDFQLSFEASGSGLDEQRVTGFAKQLRDFGEDFHLATGKLDAPSSMRAQVNAWARAASAYPGGLNRRAMRIVANSSTSRFGVRMHFKSSGQPDHLQVFAHPARPLDARHHLAWSGAPSGQPPPEDPALASLLDGAQTLVIDHEGAVIALDATTPVDQACARALALDEWVRRRVDGPGGYR